MKKILFITVLFFAASNMNAQYVPCKKDGVFLPGTLPCTNGDYYLVFEDNFDGNSFDQTKWYSETGVHSDFEFEGMKQWLQPENIEVSNGTLKIIAKKLETPYVGTFVTDWSTNPPTTKTDVFEYTSANLLSHQEFYYGKYEIRCRLPNGKGYWPAFWTFGGPGWNEIDFFEMYGDDIKKFTCNIHHGQPGEHEHCPFELKNAADFTQWHVITCIFDFDKITWQIDGNTVRVLHRFSTISGSPISCGENIGIGTYFMERAFPLQSMRIIMNLAVQSGSNAPDANTVFPGIYEIDYVRYYVKSEQQPDCLARVEYQNTNQLPQVTQASSYIQASNNVTVQSGQDVTFKAPTITLLPGFTAQAGSTFSATPEGCTYQSSKSIPMDDYIDNIVYVDDENTKNTSPVYQISDTTNIDFEITSKDEFGKTVITTFNKELLIYPNPTNDKLNVYFSANKNTLAFIIITDINGKVFFKEQIQNEIGTNNKTIDVSQFSNGTYILSIVSNNEKIENKFIISK